MKKALIFDFDGVIVESETQGFALLKKMMKSDFDLDLPKSLFKHKVGKSTVSFLKEFFSDQLTTVEIEQLYAKLKKETSSDFTKYITPHTSIIQFIKENSEKYDIAIASMNTREYIKIILRHYEIIKCIKVILTREEVQKHKQPDPEVYNKTLQRLQCRPDDALVIEDTPLGVESANNAGIDCVVVLNGQNKRSDFKCVKVKEFIPAEEFTLHQA